MKRYLVFQGEYYYPAGGWADFRAAFDNLEDAKAAVTLSDYGWTQIVDLESMTEVEVSPK